ncbi:Polyol transporter 5 [Morella rubra]|uniref:Polyol transporter 5 n=1 Tax=Morella rubra TaxID=262757 RepID=A0A6A1V7U4_9ROSI|nr:Polyol transporter 5 [Morella rubra]
MTFLSLSKGITFGGAFFLYASIATVSWVFFYFMLPETQGRTLEDMEGIFGNLRWKCDQEQEQEQELEQEQEQGDYDETVMGKVRYSWGVGTNGKA